MHFVGKIIYFINNTEKNLPIIYLKIHFMSKKCMQKLLGKGTTRLPSVRQLKALQCLQSPFIYANYTSV